MVQDRSIALRVTRTLPASGEQVFRAWTDAEVLTRWWWPSPTISIDARAGGSYHFTDARYGVGVAGRFLEFHPPTRLAYTWVWDGEQDEYAVTVEFHDHGPATEVVVEQRGFADTVTRDSNVRGWTDCLDRLDRLCGELRR